MGSTATGPIIPPAQWRGPEAPLGAPATSFLGRHSAVRTFPTGRRVVCGCPWSAPEMFLKCSATCDSLSCSVNRRREAFMRHLSGLVLGIGLLAGSALAPQAWGQDRRQNEPGNFDFYLLSLSWSPSFCETAGDRKSAQQQCGERPYSFVVHGLWPQYERGFPEFCQQPA